MCINQHENVLTANLCSPSGSSKSFSKEVAQLAGPSEPLHLAAPFFSHCTNKSYVLTKILMSFTISITSSTIHQSTTDEAIPVHVHLRPVRNYYSNRPPWMKAPHSISISRVNWYKWERRAVTLLGMNWWGGWCERFLYEVAGTRPFFGFLRVKWYDQQTRKWALDRGGFANYLCTEQCNKNKKQRFN